jgi:hypothetical protein
VLEPKRYMGHYRNFYSTKSNVWGIPRNGGFGESRKGWKLGVGEAFPGGLQWRQLESLGL